MLFTISAVNFFSVFMAKHIKSKFAHQVQWLMNIHLV